MNKETRYTFRQDGDCHWYLLTVEEAKEFDRMKKRLEEVDEMSEEFEDLCCAIDNFDRINYPEEFTFTDPKV